MKTKNISTQSNQILTYFNQVGKDCFAYADAIDVLPQSSESALKELLSDMVKRGLLMRLKKGLYYIIPLKKILTHLCLIGTLLPVILRRMSITILVTTQLCRFIT